MQPHEDEGKTSRGNPEGHDAPPSIKVDEQSSIPSSPGTATEISDDIHCDCGSTFTSDSIKTNHARHLCISKIQNRVAAYKCLEPNCDASFSRFENCRAHYRHAHQQSKDAKSWPSSLISEDSSEKREAFDPSAPQQGNGSDSHTSTQDNDHDSTREQSVLDCSKQQLISRLMDEICSSFYAKTSFHAHSPGQSPRNSSSPAHSQIVRTSTEQQQYASVRSQGKRPRETDGPSEEDGEGGRKRRPGNKPNPPCSDAGLPRHFACPFHKLDTIVYSNLNSNPRLALKYRSCGPPGWPTIGKMKYVLRFMGRILADT